MIKERLHQYKWIKENINNLENRLLEIDTQLQKITNTLQTDKVQTTKDNDKWTLLIQKRMEVEELINAGIEKGLKEMAYIERLIDGLDERSKLLMRYRYIDCMRWEEVAYRMHYEWRTMHYIHAEALKKLSKI